MVFKEKIKAEIKASVTFLWEQDDVPVKEIHVVQRCGISRASVHHCLKSANQAQKKNKEHGRPRLINVCQERKIQRTIARLCEQEGNFSCHRIRAEAVFYNVSLWTINRTLKWMRYTFLEARKKRNIIAERFQRVFKFCT